VFKLHLAKVVLHTGCDVRIRDKKGELLLREGMLLTWQNRACLSNAERPSTKLSCGANYYQTTGRGASPGTSPGAFPIAIAGVACEAVGRLVGVMQGSGFANS